MKSDGLLKFERKSTKNMSNFYLYFKALHIFGFVSWFAGLFYLVRMFVYHAEVKEKPAHLQDDWKKQFTLMQWRVYKIISTPAMVITWIFGLLMLIFNPYWFSQSWIYLKLALLIGLTVYHFYCRKVIIQLENNNSNATSFNFRLLNEVPTLFLVAIVLLAVAKDLLNFAYLFAGIIAFGVVLYFFAKLYKRNRENGNQNT